MCAIVLLHADFYMFPQILYISDALPYLNDLIADSSWCLFQDLFKLHNIYFLKDLCNSWVYKPCNTIT